MLKAGFASEDITPPRDCTLQGYEFRFTDEPAGNDGVNDPLLVRALVLQDGAAAAVIVSLDTCIVSTALARRLRRSAAEAAGTDAARVLLCCTHTHSGPAIDEPAEAYGSEAGWLAKPAPADTPGRRYVEFMAAKMKLAVTRAAALNYPVSISAVEAPLGIGYCRRVMTSEGLKHNWGPCEHAGLACPPMTDPACTLIAFREVLGPRSFLLWSVGVHPVTLGRTSRVVSADYPGAACRTIEQLLPGSRAMFVLGAAGNTHPWIATQDDVAGVETVGRAAGAMVALMSNGLRGESPRSKLEGDGGAKGETGAKGIDGGGSGDGGGSSAGAASGDAGGGTVAIVNRTMEFAGKPVDLAVWRLGPATIAASPTELFGELSADLRHRIGGPVVAATCANGWTGYWPTAAAFAEGKYEVDSALAAGRVAGDSERLVAALAEMAKEVR